MSPRRTVTLKQVAEQAKVSRAAASFALSGRPGVSEATRERVLRIAEDLGYSPNRIARNLRASSTGVIAVYLPENVTTMSYYMEATFGMIDQAESTGRIVTFIPHSREVAKTGAFDADGIIILDPVPEDPLVVRLLDLELPVVSGEPIPPGLREPEGQVVSDHVAATVEILDAFAAAGAKAPALVTTDERMSWVTIVEDTYRSWCAHHQSSPRLESASLENLAASTRQATRELLTVEPADAILALTEGSVLNVVTSAAEFGRTVGDDLLVAAAVDSPILGYTDPAITAVDLRPRNFGRTCVSVLERVLSGEQERSGQLSDTVQSTVIHRASTASSAT